MPGLTPVFADGIDLPMFLLFGAAVLVPLLAINVSIEAGVLRRISKLPFGKLVRLTFVANGLSLLAGIPVKILNSWLDTLLLPDALHRFFDAYPKVLLLGALNYFLVTVAVEFGYSVRWLRRRDAGLRLGIAFRGIVLANLASYAVLVPAYWLLTSPSKNGNVFTADARWTNHPTNVVLYLDSASHYLKDTSLDGTRQRTLVPLPMEDYLVSADLNLCLFRGTNGDLCLYRRDTAQLRVVAQRLGRFCMDQVAFSPSGRFVVLGREEAGALTVFDQQSDKSATVKVPWKVEPFTTRVVSTTNDFEAVVLHGTDTYLLSISNGPAAQLNRLLTTNLPVEFACFGRIANGNETWFSFDGIRYCRDECGNLRAVVWVGLDSSLQIFVALPQRKDVGIISARSGILHFADFYLTDCVFVPGCDECLFTAGQWTYLFDFKGKRVGPVAQGERFILLTSRFQKTMHPPRSSGSGASE